MSNRRVFKKMYSDKINKEDNYKEIFSKIESNNINHNLWKKILVPVSSIMLVCLLILINLDEKGSVLDNSLNNYILDENRGFEIYINNISITNSSSNDNDNAFTTNDMVDVGREDIDYNELVKLDDYKFLDNLNIPIDLENRIYRKLSYVDNKYYEFVYHNDDRDIVLLFTDSDSFIDNIDKDNVRISKINDTDVVIYLNDNKYRVMFKYNSISFRIEMNNITQEELISLLVSIIK